MRRNQMRPVEVIMGHLTEESNFRHFCTWALTVCDCSVKVVLYRDPLAPLLDMFYCYVLCVSACSTTGLQGFDRSLDVRRRGWLRWVLATGITNLMLTDLPSSCLPSKSCPKAGKGSKKILNMEQREGTRYQPISLCNHGQPILMLAMEYRSASCLAPLLIHISLLVCACNHKEVKTSR